MILRLDLTKSDRATRRELRRNASRDIDNFLVRVNIKSEAASLNLTTNGDRFGVIGDFLKNLKGDEAPKTFASALELIARERR